MSAKLLYKEKVALAEGHLIEVIAWEVPFTLKYPDCVRYRLAFVPQGGYIPAILYDNHYPKGHHRHVEGKEYAYVFCSVDKTISDFKQEVRQWIQVRENLR